MIIKICEKCDATDLVTFKKELEKQNVDIELDVKCHSCCGIGRFEKFVIFNDKMITADSDEELVSKIKKELRKL